MRTVVYTGNRAVYESMGAACRSMIYHRGADKIFLLTEDDVFPEQLPECVENINVRGQKFFLPDGPNFRNRWSYLALMKAAVPLMPNISGRVLVMDIDALVCGNIDALWGLPKGPLYMAREVGRREEYYNSGVMLMDTEDLFADFTEVVRQINVRHYDFGDQDVINQIMRGRIKTLPPEYNVSDWTVKPAGETLIKHYAAIRDWSREPIYLQYARMSWDEAMRGPADRPPCPPPPVFTR